MGKQMTEVEKCFLGQCQIDIGYRQDTLSVCNAGGRGNSLGMVLNIHSASSLSSAARLGEIETEKT